MPKFLITRCSTYDMAGMAMIQGAALGLKAIYADAEFGALVFHKDSRPRPENEYPRMLQFIDPEDRQQALFWADCCLDLGGLCKGSDPYRLEYIKTCRLRDIPYIYLAVSFDHPDPQIVKDVPATARGFHSCCEYSAATGKKVEVVPDLSFIIKPRYDAVDNYVRADHPMIDAAYITHAGKPWQQWIEKCKSGECNGDIFVQPIFKPENHIAVWEPPIGVQPFLGLPPDLYGLIGKAKSVYTCRYHAAVAAIMHDIPYQLPEGMPNFMKYHDLEYWKGLGSITLADEAMYSCRFVKEVLNG